MSGMVESNFLQALGWAVLNSLWQMALLWVFYQFIIGAFKLSRSSQKSSLATAMLLAGFAWFVYTFIAIITSSSNTVISSTFINVHGNEKLNNWLRTSLPIASVVYLGLLLLPSLQFIRNYRYVQVIRYFGLTKPDVQWRMFVKKVAVQMGIKKSVKIWISELVSSPVTIGYLKPVILVPLAAINHLSTEQMEAVLLHELSHIRRFDYLINLVINLIQTILYFNPFVKALVKTVEREREKSCDEMVVQFQYDPHGYASALLLLEKTNHITRPLAVAAAGRKYDLLQRIELILGIHKKPVISFNRLAGLLAGLLCVIALNALFIFSKPANRNKEVSFTHLSSPFLYLTDDGNNSETTPVKETPVVAKKDQKDNNKGNSLKAGLEMLQPEKNSDLTSSPFINVKFSQPIEVPKLKTEQEAQVKQAMAMSKRVIQETEWKTLEKTIADVMTTREKDKIKSAYDEEFAKMNWQEWENKLRLAYDRVDWNRINDQLGKAVMDIKIDSLQKVYNNVIVDLNTIKEKLNESNLNGIPDTDITLQSIEKNQEQVQKFINKLKAARTKKIIRL